MAPPTAIDVHADSDTSAIVLPNPLDINGITENRKKAGKLMAGVAAYSDSDHFKSPWTHTKPKAKRWDRGS